MANSTPEKELGPAKVLTGEVSTMIGASAATSTDGEFGGEQEHPDLGDRANCSTMSSSGQRKTLSLTSLLLLTSILSTLLIQLNAFLSAAAKVAVLLDSECPAQI